jgi:hypothetical protein
MKSAWQNRSERQEKYKQMEEKRNHIREELDISECIDKKEIDELFGTIEDKRKISK